MTEDKGIKLLVKSLQSNDTNEILFTINQIRNSGDPKILPDIFDLLIQNPQEEVRKAIIELINELKNQKATMEIINALKNDKYISIRKEILSSCWSSGLDYSEHLELLVEIFIASDFILAFEAFTIIETFETEYDAELINPLIDKLKNNLSESEDLKKGLIVELIHLLEHKKITV